jgi:hypothetical protein
MSVDRNSKTSYPYLTTGLRRFLDMLIQRWEDKNQDAHPSQGDAKPAFT